LEGYLCDFGAIWREVAGDKTCIMDEVKFLYDCVKAGKLSTDEAKSFLSSGGSSSRLGESSSRPAATVPARNETGI